MERRISRRLGSIGRSVAALAMALGLGNAAAADEAPLEGDGFVTAKSAVEQTVTIGSARYRVTEDTRLVGGDGGRMTFGGIPVQSDDGDGGGQDGHVHFEARSAGGDLPELELLRTTPMPR
jgi:hypothetical protein